MARNEMTSRIVDGILKLAIGGGAITIMILAPNAVQLLDKPVQRYMKNMDDKAQAREWQRVLAYMKKKRLLAENYEHGLTITKLGKKRLEETSFNNMTITAPKKWDKKWRLVLYDIPEKHKQGRDALTAKLRQLGFYQLQRSVWVYPFECHKEIEAVSLHFYVSKYISYIETEYIDKQKLLIKKFPKLNFH